ncbi:unnamed protein product [Colias eurytheme]|nr:unnamed protein product [Colias eurytheme]
MRCHPNFDSLTPGNQGLRKDDDDDESENITENEDRTSGLLDVSQLSEYTQQIVGYVAGFVVRGELFTYKSVDTATNQEDVVNYPTAFLNSLELPGLSPHNLQLKVGSVVIMLRNINQPRLCNRTRLAVKKLMNNDIEAKIIKGKYKGEDVLIPRIPKILLKRIHWTSVYHVVCTSSQGYEALARLYRNTFSKGNNGSRSQQV